jgi:hypothetical protein
MGQRSTVEPYHDFKERLAFSEQAGHEPFWDAVYRKAFPNMVNHMPCPGDHESQRQGIDRLILLNNGATLKIDEKKREKDRPDILLEYLSNDVTNAPGWIEKNLAIDYIAYAFMPSKRVYMLPWHFLKAAWQKNKAEWLKQYKIPPAQNNGYRTHCVAVPINVLYNAVYKATLIQL